jgi:hypothetical protein
MCSSTLIRLADVLEVDLAEAVRKKVRLNETLSSRPSASQAAQVVRPWIRSWFWK